jgi:hypothetical protein
MGSLQHHFTLQAAAKVLECLTHILEQIELLCQRYVDWNLLEFNHTMDVVTEKSGLTVAWETAKH